RSCSRGTRTGSQSPRRPCFIQWRETPSGSEEGNGEGAGAKRGPVLKPVPRIFLLSLACIVILFGWLSADTKASNFGVTTLMVDGDAATIFRDEFGVPHIFAHTNSALFEAYGFTVAEARLWQLELNRRAARR